MLVLALLWGVKVAGSPVGGEAGRGEEEWSPLAGQGQHLKLSAPSNFSHGVLTVQLSQTCAFCWCFCQLHIMCPLNQALCPEQKGKTNMAVGGVRTPT